jgi:hypothetical protein
MNAPVYRQIERNQTNAGKKSGAASRPLFAGATYRLLL